MVGPPKTKIVKVRFTEDQHKFLSSFTQTKDGIPEVVRKCVDSLIMLQGVSLFDALEPPDKIKETILLKQKKVL